MDKRMSYELALNILDNIRGLVVVDNDGIIVYIEPEYAAVFGFTQEEAIGHHIRDIIQNSELPTILNKKKPVWGKYFRMTSHYVEESPGSVCNRVPIYPNGDRASVNILGAMAYSSIERGHDTNSLLLELEQITHQNTILRSHLAEVYRADREMVEILGVSTQVQKLKEMICRIAGTASTVCIIGETGTGKELVANAIHKLSKRLDKPFVKINCAAIPKDLMESELFGYEPGAFTGASRQGKIGKFELANNGTLLLDEIGELPLDIQAKLLRVLQSGEVERVGGAAPVSVDVRIICSTNRNLRQMVQQGTFRADLYYRINVVEIKTPPLRERRIDIPLLVDHFIKTNNERHGLDIVGTSEKARNLLKNHDWPGNVRELENSMERACIICGAGEIKEEHFDFLKVEHESIAGGSDLGRKIGEFKSQRKTAEFEIILNALKASGGNKAEAARILNVSRSTLYRKLERYGIII